MSTEQVGKPNFGTAAVFLTSISSKEGMDRRSIINERSRDADLAIIGFRGEALRHQKTDLFFGYDGIGNILFVNTKKEIEIVPETEEEEPAHDESRDEESTPPTDSTPSQSETDPKKEPPQDAPGSKT